MDPVMAGRIGDALLDLFIGAFCLLLAFRKVGKKPSVSEAYDAWFAKFGQFFKWGGYLLIFLALIRLVTGH